MVFICIPIFNRLSYTITCLNSIRLQKYSDYTVVICDDGSTDGSGAYLAENAKEVVVLKGDGNLWWTGGTNKCIEYALTIAKPNDYIFTLNNDTELTSDALSILVEFADKNPGSIVSGGNYFKNDKYLLEPTAFKQRDKWPFSLFHTPMFSWAQDSRNLDKKIWEADSLSGKGVLIPVDAFKKLGLYNFEKLPQYHSDQEFIRRARDNGYKIYINLNAVIYTDESASGIGQINSKVSIKEFFESFFTLRSANHLKTLYNRSKIIYKRKWPVYFVANVLAINVKFMKRLFKAKFSNSN